MEKKKNLKIDKPIKSSLLIKHVEKTTLIDYPNEIASIVFVGGCNFKCSYCYNKQLLNPKDTYSIDSEACLELLRGRRKYIDAVVVTGGEPTIHSGLINFLKELKKLGLKVKLDTNGYAPQVLKQVIYNQIVDYIAMDIKAPLSDYSEITGIKVDTDLVKKSIDIIKKCNILNEFRTTVWQGFFNKYSCEDILDLVKDSQSYFLHNFLATPDNDLNSFQPSSKAEISSFLEKARPYVKKIELRGDWY